MSDLQFRLWGTPADVPEFLVFDLAFSPEWERPMTAHIAVLRRLCNLAVLRELQMEREADVVTLRERYHLPGDRLAFTLRQFKQAGATVGEPAGIDPENGYSYHRWKIVDDRAAKEVARTMKCPLMPPEGKAHILGPGR